jgi:3-oxoacyl-[acyl-carrier protein] reductase
MLPRVWGAWSRGIPRDLFTRRANAVSPGTIATRFHEGYSTREKLEATARAIPLHRLGTPEDCAGAFLYLASPRLAGYVTGQVLEVNGGQLMP